MITHLTAPGHACCLATCHHPRQFTLIQLMAACLKETGQLEDLTDIEVEEDEQLEYSEEEAEQAQI